MEEITIYIFEFNFVIVSILFLLFIREKNYLAHVREILTTNKLAIKLYFLFVKFFNISNNTIANRMD